MAHRWKVLAVTSIGLFMASLDLFIVNIAFPDLSTLLRRRLAVEPLLGPQRLRDHLRRAARPGRPDRRPDRPQARLHHRPAHLPAASALCAVAPSIPFLVGARVLQAVGAAMMIPTTLGLLLPAFPAEQRPVAIGIWSAVSGVAAALGPPIGGLLVQLSWHWIFLVNVPIGLITAFAAIRILDEVKEPDDGRPDLLGAAPPRARHRRPHPRHRPGPRMGLDRRRA